MLQDKLLDTVNEYADAADRNDERWITRHYFDVQTDLTTLRRSFDPDDPRVDDLREIYELIWIIKSDPDYNGAVPVTCIDRPLRRDHFTTENIRIRVKRVRELTSSTKDLSQPPVAKKIIQKALGYTDGRKFEKDHPNKLKKVSPKQWQAKLDEFTSEEGKKIVTAIGALPARKKAKK